jgi:hypothetical protein
VDLDHNSIHSCEFFLNNFNKKKYSFLLLTQFSWTEIDGWFLVLPFLFLFQSFLSCWNIHTYLPALCGYLNFQRTAGLRLWKCFWEPSVIWMVEEPHDSGF